MDIPWAIGELSAFIDLAALVTPAPTPGVTFFGDDRHPRGGKDALIIQAQVVEQILDRALPDWRVSVPANKHHRWEQHREAAIRAVAQLQRQEEVAEKLGETAHPL